jgi:hypothetical protein
MDVLLEDLNNKVDREDIFKLTIGMKAYTKLLMKIVCHI